VKEELGNTQHINRDREAVIIILIIRLKDHIPLPAVHLRLRGLTHLPAGHPHREAAAGAEEAAAVLRAEGDNGANIK
jgi:hypothetical protein